MSTSSSLRFRLMAANILTKQVVILLAGVLLLASFNRLMYRQASEELDAVLTELASNLVRDANGAISLQTGIADHRYHELHSGWYWQVASGGAELKSKSLAQTSLSQLPIDPAEVLTADSPTQSLEAAGPASQSLYLRSRAVLIASGDSTSQGQRAVLIVGRDVAPLAERSRTFRNHLILALGGLAALLLTSAWFQIKTALRSAETLRLALERIRLGIDRRIGADFPNELQPLISEANRLLDAQDAAIEKARARAGDLAHGLRTPLTAVGVLAERLHLKGEFEISDDIIEQVETASRHIDRELARTRVAAEHRNGFRTNFESVATRVLSTMEKLPRGDDIHWTLEAGENISMAVDETDSIEILGSLLDNSRKWARANVGLRAEARTNAIEISVEDDGPGVADEGYDLVLRRGVRLDESSAGTGLGLTIVKDIVEAYGGSIDLYRANLGGLGVRLSLPRAIEQFH